MIVEKRQPNMASHTKNVKKSLASNAKLFNGVGGRPFISMTLDDNYLIKCSCVGLNIILFLDTLVNKLIDDRCRSMK